MHIEKYLSNGMDCLRLVRTIRVRNDLGKSVNRKVIVKTFGALAKYDDGKPDFLQRLRQSFVDKTPLIAELLPYVDQAPRKKYTIVIEEGDAYCFGSPKLLAPCILDPVFSALGLDGLFASVKHASKISYDLQGIVRLLVYGRLLNPASKIATARQNEAYYQPLVSSSNESNVYDALDVIYENRQKILRRMNTCITRLTGRATGTLFYDVTNFFFETEQPDGDVTGSDGLVLAKGLRKMGVSKENRKQPIVQMGLFLDEDGIPVSIEIFPGNTLDHLTLRRAMKETVDTLSLGRFILVADRGMYSGTNMCHVVSQGDGYIVSKSLKKSSKTERAWALEPDGYVAVGDDFRYKSRIVERTVTGEDGSKRQMKEKVVVYWSRSFYAREERENRSFLTFLEKLKESPHGFRVSASQSRSLRKFIKKELVHKDTGEVVDSRKLLSMIDEAKLTEFREMMGYYQIVSSELEMDALEIIDKYHGLTRIEDQFREMKGTLETRPIFVNTPEHIQAHLLVCFMALTMLRVIQHKIKKSLPEEKGRDLDWSYGLPGNRLSKALREWTVEQLSNEYFRINNMQSNDLKQILEAVHLSLPRQLFTRGQLRSLKSLVKIL